MSSIFLSYRRSDAPNAVARLHTFLRARLPRWTVFYDHTQLVPGEDFHTRLQQEVAASTVTLVFIGPRWLPTPLERAAAPGLDHVREEVGSALASGCTVIPILVENSSMPAREALEPFADLLPLVRRNGRSLRPDPDFDADAERLAAF